VVAETELDQDPFLLSPVGSVGSIQEQGAMTAMNGLVYTSDSANPGNLYSYDTTNPGSGVQPITFNSIYSPPGATMQPALNSPDGICTDYKQSIYICETGFNDIKQYNLATGNVTLLAGGAPDTLAQLDGLGNQASFFDPAGCAFDPVRHVLYVSDRSGNTIRVIK
jgi:sugar lactone lactonase YvrE